jgi:hypothetical protein
VSEPINVTPGGAPGASRDDEFSQRYYAERAEGPEWSGWTWSSRGRSFPWLGILLVLIGVALLVEFLVPAISFTTLLLLAIALAFLAGWVLGGSRVAMVPGLLILALGVAELIEDMAVLGPAGADVNGLWSVSLAIAFLAIWAIDFANKRRSRWPLWGAAIFGLIGFIQMSSRFTGLPDFGIFWPILIIGAGVVLLLGARQRAT